MPDSRSASRLMTSSPWAVSSGSTVVSVRSVSLHPLMAVSGVGVPVMITEMSLGLAKWKK